MIVGVCAADVSIVRVPIVLLVSEVSAERAADFVHSKVIGRRFRLAIRSQDISYTIPLGEVTFAGSRRDRK